MGKYKHHSGAVGGGKNLSNAKTPHDKDIKDMPLFKMGKPYSMGASMRGPLDKHGRVFTNSWEEEDVKKGKKEMAEGHKGHAEALFDDAHGSWNWSKSHHSTGAEMRGPLNQAKPDYIDIDGDGDKKESMKQAASQKGAEMRGPLNQEGNPTRVNLKKCKPGFKMHNGECVKIGTKVSGWGPTKEKK